MEQRRVLRAPARLESSTAATAAPHGVTGLIMSGARVTHAAQMLWAEARPPAHFCLPAPRLRGERVTRYASITLPPAPPTRPLRRVAGHSDAAQSSVTGSCQRVQVVQPGDTVVDATCGNGHDTCALARLAGPSGTVHAFDVQPEAIAATRAAVDALGISGAAQQPDRQPHGGAATATADLGLQVHFHLESHELLKERLPARSVAAVAFNLGYLPHGDHARTTTAASTVAAVSAACHVCFPRLLFPPSAPSVKSGRCEPGLEHAGAKTRGIVHHSSIRGARSRERGVCRFGGRAGAARHSRVGCH